jgi:thymidylate synthase ThyX
MSYNVEILKDSIANDQRITTVELTFPRFILAEVNTHRMFSRNSASSRAIPTEKIIERVENEPFIPETFNRRVKGMGVGDKLPDADSIACKNEWLHARTEAVIAARFLMETNVDKSRVNRLLEPFMWHTAIITATDWDNFFALRDHPEAQPEFQIIASLLNEAMKQNDPQTMEYGKWHLPLVEDEEMYDKNWKYSPHEIEGWEYWAWVSAGRCARSSYDKIHDPETKDQSYSRAEKLKGAGHMSPFEHQARPFTENQMLAFDVFKRNMDIIWSPKSGVEAAWMKSAKRGLEYSGNFRLWNQFRKLFDNEENFANVGA